MASLVTTSRKLKENSGQKQHGQRASRYDVNRAHMLWWEGPLSSGSQCDRGSESRYSDGANGGHVADAGLSSLP